MSKKGRGKEDLTIDRIKDELGYRPGNLQVLPNGENVRKKNKARGWSSSAHMTAEEKAKYYSNVPF